MRSAAACLLVFFFVGCGGNRTPAARSRDDIFAEKQNLPGLYLTTKTHTRVIAPRSKGNFIDEKTNEECWAALQCTYPDCPGRKGDEPSLFTTADVKVHGGCPACAKVRNFKAATTPLQKAEILKHIRPYELPEVAARSKALDEELKRSFDADAKGRGSK